jgi:hypothetical protein
MPPCNKTCNNNNDCNGRNEKEFCQNGLPIAYAVVTDVTRKDCVQFVSSSKMDRDTGNLIITHLFYHGSRSLRNRTQIIITIRYTW